MVASFHNTEPGLISESAWYTNLARASVGCTVFDSDGRILSVSHSFAEMLDCTVDLIIGQNVFEMLVFPEGITTQDMLAKNSGLRVIARQNSRSFDWCMHRVVNDAASPSCFIGLLSDENLPEGFEQQVEHKDRLATLGGLTAGVTHEIATPLAVIANNAELLLDVDQMDHDTRQSLAIIRDEAHRLGGLLHDILRFAHDAPLATKPNDVMKLVNSVTRLFNHQLRDKNLTLRIDVESDLPPLVCDAERLQQVFFNLIQNACDASSNDGEVHLLARRAATKAGAAAIEFVIMDRGEGIAAADLDRIYRPFFSTKAIGKGTGLGLPIAQRIITAHKGELNVTSQLGEGTQVVVVLPLWNYGEPSPQRELFESCVMQ